jgi:hypothetical protein
MCGRFTNQFTWRVLVELYRITELHSERSRAAHYSLSDMKLLLGSQMNGKAGACFRRMAAKPFACAATGSLSCF